MKKAMKQLFAVFMAVAMVLSLSVTAWAADPDPDPYRPYDSSVNVISGGTVSGGAALPSAGGSANGSSTSEGPEPDDPIEIILPTVTSTEDDTKMGVFDMILDPHNMIVKTKGARYTVSGGSTKTFDDAGATVSGDDYSAFPKLYFATEVSSTAEKYSGTSQELKIINKGRQEVNVDLSLDFTYPEEVDLVASKADLDNATNGLNDGAQMYLALLRGDETKAVTALSGDEVPSPMISVGGKGDYLDGTAIVFEWGDDVADEVKADVGKLTFTVSYADPEPETTTASGDTVDAIPAKISVAGEWDGSSYTVGSGDTLEVSAPGEDEEFSGEVIATVLSGDATIATVTFTLRQPNDRTMKEDETQTVKFKAPADGAVIRTAIAAKQDAYEYAVWDGTGTKPQGTTDKGYYWKQDTTILESAYPYITFKLEGDINNDLEWDRIYTDAAISFVLTWDVLPRTTYNKGIVAEAVNENGTGGVTDEYPTVTVTQPATSSRAFILTVTPGKGAYAAYVPQSPMKIGSKSVNMTYDATANTLTSSTANSTTYSNIGTAGKGTITFKATGLEDYQLEVTGLR